MNAKYRGFLRFPDISKLESANPVIRAAEIARADATVQALSTIDDEAAHPNQIVQFAKDFGDGFTSVFKAIWNTGENAVKTADNVLSSSIWITQHPYLLLSGIILLFILAKKI